MSVPKLRFKEFDGDWQQARLSELATKITDGTHDTPVVQKEGVPFLTAINVKDGLIDYDNIGYVDELTHQKIYERCNPEKNDLLIVNIGAGTASCARNIVDYPFSLKNVALIKPNINLLNPLFLEQTQRRSAKKIFSSLTSGGAQPFLSLKEIGKFLINYSGLEEQTKIANFLSSVDEKISQLTQKHELLSQYKQGIMQKLFSQQIRFKADDGSEFGDWEEKKFKEVILIKYGKDHKKLKSGDIPVLGTGGIMRYVDSYLYDGESILIGRKGTIDKPIFISGKFWTVDTLFYTEIGNEIIPRFVYQQLLMVNWLKLNEATGVPSLNTTSIGNIDLKIPCLEEQTKIANFLSAIDQKIEVVAQQIEQAKTWKKGLLQQMFV